MNNQNAIIASLAMDLKRVAIGQQRGSTAMANRFTEEALRRQAELEQEDTTEYLKKLITSSRQMLLSQKADTYEDVLMYSTLFQNIAQLYSRKEK